MSQLGSFLELGVPAPAVPESLAFYRALGFTELLTADIRSWPYAAVTDGQVIIGLHGAGLEQPALGFVRSDLAHHLGRLAQADLPTVFTRLGDDEFHEAGLMAPDEQLLILMEAATCSAAGADEAPPPLIGRSSEISLRCVDPERCLAFWTALGFLAVSEEDSRTLRICAAGLTLGIRPEQRQPGPLLRFESAAPDVRGQLAALGIAAQPHPEGMLLRAPEGTALLLVTAS